MNRWEGRVALVTGASCGIGAAICKQLVEAGMIVIGAARAVERIETLANELKSKRGTLVGVKCDLRKDDNIANLFKFIKDTYKGIDVCINNAGMSRNHSLLEGSTDEWREMLDINVVALCLCTKMAVKSMQERGVDDGHIIHINSISGHWMRETPQTSFYASTKHAVRALTEGLRQELRGLNSNIRISAISPGVVATEFALRMRGEKVGREMYKTNPCLKTEDVVDSVCHVLSVPAHVQIHDMIIKPVGERF